MYDAVTKLCPLNNNVMHMAAFKPDPPSRMPSFNPLLCSSHPTIPKCHLLPTTSLKAEVLLRQQLPIVVVWGWKYQTWHFCTWHHMMVITEKGSLGALWLKWGFHAHDLFKYYVRLFFFSGFVLMNVTKGCRFFHRARQSWIYTSLKWFLSLCWTGDLPLCMIISRIFIINRK